MTGYARLATPQFRQRESCAGNATALSITIPRLLTCRQKTIGNILPIALWVAFLLFLAIVFPLYSFLPSSKQQAPAGALIVNCYLPPTLWIAFQRYNDKW